jgi:hypothetical protein
MQPKEMQKRLIAIPLLLIWTTALLGQDPEINSLVTDDLPKAPQPFLFSVTTLTPDTQRWSINYAGAYGERVTDPFGYSGLGQEIALMGNLGNRFSLYAKAAFGFSDGVGVASAQQLEVIRDIIGGKSTQGFRFGLGLGGRNDFDNVGALFSRLVATYNTSFWRLNGNILFEKAFGRKRDAIDVITSLGIQYRLWDNFYAGVEALGEDLEGFWEEEEAEGGAKILVGPSINLSPKESRFSFSTCGGPVIYATRSQAVASDAIRDLPRQNGFMVQARIVYDLSGI